MAKTKKELESENKILTKKVNDLEAEIIALNQNIELMKKLIQRAQTRIPNYNLYPGRLGLPSSRVRLC